MKQEVKATEQGWAGHFICSHICSFRRNTLVEFGGKRIIVSTVGAMQEREEIKNYTDEQKKLLRQVGYERYYETMVFWAKFDAPYWHADVRREVSFDADWSINELEYETDLKANEMHEKVVKEIKEKILTLKYPIDED
jgi:hypothetical protein